MVNNILVICSQTMTEPIIQEIDKLFVMSQHFQRKQHKQLALIICHTFEMFTLQCVLYHFIDKNSNWLFEVEIFLLIK